MAKGVTNILQHHFIVEVIAIVVVNLIRTNCACDYYNKPKLFIHGAGRSYCDLMFFKSYMFKLNLN